MKTALLAAACAIAAAERHAVRLDAGLRHAFAVGRQVVHVAAMMGRSTGAANDVAGRAVVVHAKADDYTSQPSGNAGDRVACGVIEITG